MAAAGWCLAALVVLTVSASLLGASPAAILAFVALEVTVVVFFLLRPQAEGAWVLWSFLGAALLALVLAFFVWFHDRSDRQRQLSSVPVESVGDADRTPGSGEIEEER